MNQFIVTSQSKSSVAFLKYTSALIIMTLKNERIKTTDIYYITLKTSGQQGLLLKRSARFAG